MANALTVRQPIVRTNIYGAPMDPSYLRITIERRFASSDRTDTYLIGARGGTVSSGNARGGGQASTTVFARWENNRLVVDTGSVSDVAKTERTEVWQYDDAGMLTVTVTERSTNVDKSTTTATHRRDSAGGGV